MSEEGQYLRRQILLALIEDDRLHGEEVKRLWDLIKEDFNPNKIFDVAWQAITQFSTEKVAEVMAVSNK
jgi:hypothetical protein